ncbi:LOW QUALITY PROTEIN: hypothetical protein HID58_014752 [Brassica napus]|uniref:Uncharacterized protein n=1 Tax=Brassica napus TaxID=3708 RepID=A0ABQ8DI21_BRANA|nr:LOW QUALITY PROTEIN: hypothetical protein HID58_014752 [Brassica napus]
MGEQGHSLMWEGLGLGGVEAVGNWNRYINDVSKPHKCPEEKWEDAEKNSNVCEVLYDTRSDDEWDKEDDENHSCGYSNETQKQLQDNSHDIVAKMDSIEKVDPVCRSMIMVKANQLETKSLEDRNCKLDNSELVMILRQTKIIFKTRSGYIREYLEEICNLTTATIAIEVKNNLHISSIYTIKQIYNLLMCVILQEKGTRSLDTTALKTELGETEDPEKAEEKFSSVSTKTSQGLFGETSFSAAEPVSAYQFVLMQAQRVEDHLLFQCIVFDCSQKNSSSPVRMAKANKKRQKGWGNILMCCRFF